MFVNEDKNIVKYKETRTVLSFVTIHLWANSKSVIDQSERALYFCYALSKN